MSCCRRRRCRHRRRCCGCCAVVNVSRSRLPSTEEEEEEEKKLEPTFVDSTRPTTNDDAPFPGLRRIRRTIKFSTGKIEKFHR